MRPAKLLPLCMLLPVLATACGGGGSGGGGGTNPPATCTDGTIVANETSNYTFSSTITLPPVKVKPMSNLTFDWGGVTKDFLGVSLNPTTDLKSIVLMLWNLPVADFQEALNTDNLFLSDLQISPPPSITPMGGATAGMLYDFNVNGTAIIPEMFNLYLDAAIYTPANSTFVLAVQSATEPGSKVRMLQSFQLDAGSSNTTVKVTNSSTNLDYHANLHSLKPMGVPASKAALKVDWSQIATNALGGDFINRQNQITNISVAHYTQTPSQLEGQFLNLETLTNEIYTGCIGEAPAGQPACTNPSGTNANLSVLTDKTGKAFPGVDATGTWLVALRCGNCRNPAPWYITILEPAAQPCAP